MFDSVALARPPGADMIVSYHAANWTSFTFSTIGMLLHPPIHDSSVVSYTILIVLAMILGVISFRGVGVVGHRGPKITSPEEQEKEGRVSDGASSVGKME